MSQVKNFTKLLLAAILVMATGCEPQDPFVNPGKTEDPAWVITMDNNMTSSMTAIIKVSFAENAGTLAAFMGEECCGIANYNDGLYTLYISPASESDGEVQLRFYSPDLKRIFKARSTFPFRNDTQLGSVSEPYTPEWVLAE